MVERLEINRNIYYLTIECVTVNNGGVIEELKDHFVAFIKQNPPSEIHFGEQLKDDNNEKLVFISPKHAKDYAIELLIKTTYPPDFLHPLHYTSENIGELMHKELIYDIGRPNSRDIERRIKGRMVEYTHATNPPNLPAEVVILTNEGIREALTFFHIKNIQRDM